MPRKPRIDKGEGKVDTLSMAFIDMCAICLTRRMNGISCRSCKYLEMCIGDKRKCLTRLNKALNKFKERNPKDGIVI